MICPQCQHWISPPQKTCSNCGYTVGAKPQTPPSSPVAPALFPTNAGGTEPMPPMAPGATYPVAPQSQTMPPTGVESATNERRGMGGLKKEHIQMGLVLGGVIVLIGVAALVLGFARDHPFLCFGLLFLAFIVGLPIAVGVLAALGAKPQHCYICGNSLSNHVYQWTLDGQSRRVCSNCNQTLKRDNSREAMKRRRGR